MESEFSSWKKGGKIIWESSWDDFSEFSKKKEKEKKKEGTLKKLCFDWNCFNVMRKKKKKGKKKGMRVEFEIGIVWFR